MLEYMTACRVVCNAMWYGVVVSRHIRDKLPDAGSPYEGQGGTVDDSVEFVLENFVEANKLWVRMHGQV